jgi:predicted transcriptional regulator
MKTPVLKFRSDKTVDHVKTGFIASLFRLSKRVSQLDVAAALEVKAGFVSMLEHGKRNWSQERLGQYITAVNAIAEKRH